MDGKGPDGGGEGPYLFGNTVRFGLGYVEHIGF
jgi:hypothetical protein